MPGDLWLPVGPSLPILYMLYRPWHLRPACRPWYHVARFDPGPEGPHPDRDLPLKM